MNEENKINMEEANISNQEGLLVPLDRYLQSGIHIGTKIKTGDMKEFIFKRRNDKIYVMDIDKINTKITQAIEYLKKYPLQDILIVATRTYAGNAANKLKEFTGDLQVVSKRFIPGTLTNPELKNFKEPAIMLVCDPRGEKEAIREANMLNVPVIALADTDNSSTGIDLVVPINNKGRKSLALFFWILTREILLKEGKIKKYDDFKVPVAAFEKLELPEE